LRAGGEAQLIPVLTIGQAIAILMGKTEIGAADKELKMYVLAVTPDLEGVELTPVSH